jgi:hypothetical protein
MANEMLVTLEDDTLLDVAGGTFCCFDPCSLFKLAGAVACGVEAVAKTGLCIVGSVVSEVGEELEEIGNCIKPKC